MIVVVMGVSGAGKTTIGKLLARETGFIYREGDDFHPRANVRKMRLGRQLTDADRLPWLRSLAKAIDEWILESADVVVSCSALKQAYRDILVDDKTGVRLVFLKGDESLICRRLQEREGHFMPAELLPSQFTALEEPADAVTVNINDTPAAIVAGIRGRLHI